MLEDALKMWRGNPLSEFSESIRVQTLLRELHSVKELAQETLLDCYLALDMYQRAAAAARLYTLETLYNERIWERHIVTLRMLGRKGRRLRISTGRFKNYFMRNFESRRPSHFEQHLQIRSGLRNAALFSCAAVSPINAAGADHD